MKNKLPKDMGQHQKPGVVKRGNIKTVEGRTGYTQNESRTGGSSKSTKTMFPKGGK